VKIVYQGKGACDEQPFKKGGPAGPNKEDDRYQQQGQHVCRKVFGGEHFVELHQVVRQPEFLAVFAVPSRGANVGGVAHGVHGASCDHHSQRQREKTCRHEGGGNFEQVKCGHGEHPPPIPRGKKFNFRWC